MPYLREPQDCLSPDSGIERVVVKKSVQTGFSEMLLNTAAFYLTHAPSGVLVVQPNNDMAKRFSRQRVESLIDLCDVLKPLIWKARSKGGNEVALKTTRNGGCLVIASAQSPAALRSLPARVVLCDEVDSYLADLGEGNPFDLAAARATTFGSLRKVVAVSTPTDDTSLIEKLFLETDQRRWFCRCPLCEFEQTLVWANLIWVPGNPTSARYRCAGCYGDIEPSRKSEFIAGGRWKPTANAPPHVRGYALNGLASPWQRWSELVAQFEAAQVSEERKKTFTNLVLAEIWKDREAAMLPEAEAIAARCEPYGPDVPMPATLITAGIDVQQDRLEIEFVGWGRAFESWSLDYSTIYGDILGPDIWQRLDRLLLREFKHVSGMSLRVNAACVDAGYQTDTVLAFTKERFNRRVYATKGLNHGWSKPIWPRRPTYSRKSLPLFLVSVDEAKRWVQDRMRIAEHGAGYMHFPTGRPLDYFRMLVAEQLMTRQRGGRVLREWVNIRRERNESWDCRVLAATALFSLLMQGLDLDAHVTSFENMIKPPSPDVPQPPAPSPVLYRSKWVNGPLR